MPTLDDTRREKFAQLIAAGASLREAASGAGYKYVKSYRSRARLARRDVADRIAEIHLERARSAADLQPVVDLLMSAATDATKLNSAAAYVAARGLLSDAARLKRIPAAQPAETGAAIPFYEREMTEEEWVAAFAPKGEAPL